MPKPSILLWSIIFQSARIRGKYVSQTKVEVGKRNIELRLLKKFPFLASIYPLIFCVFLHVFRLIEYSTAINQLAPSKNNELLDIGSGLSPLPSYFAKLGCVTVALDLSKDWVTEQKIALKHVDSIVRQNLDFIVADCAYLPFKQGSFKKISCISTIEHVDNDRQVMMEIGRVLDKDGMCVLSFPFSQHSRAYNMALQQRYYTFEDVYQRLVLPSDRKLFFYLKFGRQLMKRFFNYDNPHASRLGRFLFYHYLFGLLLHNLEPLLVKNEDAQGIVITLH